MKLRILYWAPRILAILSILFMMLFSVDCFGGNGAAKEQIICFLMHNIPAFFVILILIYAWKVEFTGGILFLLAALGGSLLFRAFNGNPGVLLILLPFIITGLLFILHHFLSKKQIN